MPMNWWTGIVPVWPQREAHSSHTGWTAKQGLINYAAKGWLLKCQWCLFLEFSRRERFLGSWSHFQLPVCSLPSSLYELIHTSRQLWSELNKTASTTQEAPSQSSTAVLKQRLPAETTSRPAA